MTNKYEHIANLFDRISKMGINNMRVLELYGGFLKDIAHNDMEAKRIYEKLEVLNKSEASNKNNSQRDIEINDLDDKRALV